MQYSEDAGSGKDTLDSVLTQLGLSTFLDNLKKEQMDLNSLVRTFYSRSKREMCFFELLKYFFRINPILSS